MQLVGVMSVIILVIAVLTIMSGAKEYFAIKLIILGIGGWLLFDKLPKLQTQQQRKEEAAVERSRQNWMENTEPKCRTAPRYPEDWEWRRTEVFLRANGHCEECGKEVGR